MTISASRRLRRALPLVLAAATALAFPWGNGAAAAVAPTSEGIMCETDASNTFSLTASSGYVSTPDGNSIYMWSYGDSGGSFQLPGPTLCVTAGSTVTVVLHNALPEDTSIIFPGQQHVTADGRPAQPQFDAGTPATLTSLVQPASAGGGQVTYSFTAGSPGTYLYTSGSDQQKQQQMGLYGGLVVRPIGHAAQENTRSDSTFNARREFLYLLSDIDPIIHRAVERGQAADFNSLRPRYFLINGRSMPDTISPNRASWLPTQPYGAMVRIQPYNATSNPDPALVRYLNAGEVNYPFHPHGSDQRVIARDGHPLTTPAGTDASYDKFLIDVGPGQTWDTLLSWTDAEHWNADTAPIPVPLPQLQDQIVGPGPQTWFSENPYLGGPVGTTPQGVTQNNQCGEYYETAHSHALNQATNYGASFGGMMTLIRIDPPSPNNCPAQ